MKFTLKMTIVLLGVLGLIFSYIIFSWLRGADSFSLGTLLNFLVLCLSWQEGREVFVLLNTKADLSHSDGRMLSGMALETAERTS